MPPALLLLLRLQTRAAVRRTLRSMRSPRRAVFSVIAILAFCLWMGPVLFSAAFSRRFVDPETVRLVAPLVLLGMCVMTLVGGGGDRVLSFTPGEVNFLFPAPFTRRQLLLFKLARMFGGALLSGGVLSLVLLQYASSWPAAFAGGVLSVALVQLLTLGMLMVAQTVEKRAYTTGRRVALGVLLAAAAGALLPGAREIYRSGAEGGVRAVAAAVHRPAAMRVLLAPMAPFARTFTAGSLRDALLWGTAAAAIDAALLLLVLRLDADYREAALAASERTFARLQRVRRGQLVPPAGFGTTGARPRVRLPLLPWLGGAGPTAWRQITSALRTSRWTLLVLLLVAGGLAPALFVTRAHFALVVMAGVWLTMFLTMTLKFDFRAELDQIAWLKALPLSPTATAAGQLAAPVLVLTAMQSLLLGAAACLAEPNQRLGLLAALPFLLPFNVLLIAVENLLFLLFPSRVAAASPGDLGQMGRQVVFLLFKLFVVSVAVGAAGAAGGLAYLVVKSVAVAVSLAFVILCAVAASLVPCVGWAYRRFDPSTDTPP